MFLPVIKLLSKTLLNVLDTVSWVSKLVSKQYQTKRKATKMNTETKTNLIAWNGETYKGLGDLFDTITELESDLDHEERLRLAIWCWNNHETPSADNLAELIENEQDAFAGGFDSVSDFVDDLLMNIGIDDTVPDWVVIDNDATYERNLRHDYFDYDVVDIDGAFRKFFWRAY